MLNKAGRVECRWNGKCEELLVLFEYCITYRDKSVDAERIGSYMNLTKSRLRQALGDESFCALVFLSFNSPALNQVSESQFQF